MSCAVLFMFGCELEEVNEYADTKAYLNVDMSSYLSSAIDDCYTSTSTYKITVKIYGVSTDNTDYSEEIIKYYSTAYNYDEQYVFSGFTAGGTYYYDIFYNDHKARSTGSFTLTVDDAYAYPTLNRYSGWSTSNGEFTCVY